MRSHTVMVLALLLAGCRSHEPIGSAVAASADSPAEPVGACCPIAAGNEFGCRAITERQCAAVGGAWIGKVPSCDSDADCDCDGEPDVVALCRCVTGCVGGGGGAQACLRACDGVEMDGVPFNCTFAFSQADFDRDCDVDLADYAVFAREFGRDMD